MNKAADRYDGSLIAIKDTEASGSIQYDSGAAPGGGVFAQSYSTEEQALSNLINLLLTNKGERYMQPKFGTRIREAVFQQNTVALEDFLFSSIRDDIKFWLPYIVLKDLVVKRDVDAHSLTIQLVIQVTEQGANVVINIMADENRTVLVDVFTEDTSGLVQVGTLGSGFAGGGY